MKKVLAAILAVLFAGGTLSARHDGSYFYNLTDRYATESLSWKDGFTPLKTLFITSPHGARDYLEMAQRFPIDFDSFVCYSPSQFASDSVYAAALSGAGKMERTRELQLKARKKYDLIVIGHAPFADFPPDSQFLLLQQVKDGAGLLILFPERLPYKRLYSQPLDTPDFLKEIQRGCPTVKIPLFKTFRFGKGRIIQATWKSERNDPFTKPFLKDGNRWQADYENIQALFLRAAFWASGKQGDALISVTKSENKLTVTGASGKILYRLRDEFNHVLSSGELSGTEFPLPPLASGQYFFDWILPGKNFGFFPFEVPSPVGTMTLDLSRESFPHKEPIEGMLKTEKALSSGGKMILTLADAPYGRIRARLEIPLASGTKELSFRLPEYEMPTAAGYLNAVLSNEKGIPIAQTCRELFFPCCRSRPGYYQITFGCPTTPIMARQAADNLGFRMALTEPTPQKARSLSLMNVRLVPYLTRVALRRNPKGGTTVKMLSSAGRKGLEKLGDDHNFYRPEMRKLWAEEIAERMDSLPKYGAVLYSLGDENHVQLNAGCGPSDEISFRDFLREKYGTIENLNREWESGCKSFSEVKHRPLEQSLKEKKFPEWNDHCEYMEKMFRDIHHFAASEIRKRHPGAQVGLEGTFGQHDLEQMMEKLDWWGPYADFIENEVLRSLFPDVPRFVWNGYHGERVPGRAPSALEHLLKGTVNGLGWYSLGCDFNHDLLSSDQSPSYPDSFIKELQRLRFGTAQFLIDNPLAENGLAVWWNHLSRRANTVDSRCVTPESGIASLLRFCYRNGLGLEFITEKTAERLKKTRILFLLGTAVLSDSEAEKILDFVQGGGTVIADFPPGVLNGFMRRRTVYPLAPLFGEHSLLSPQHPKVAPLDIPGLRSPKALLASGEKPVQTRCYGKGRAYLLNFNFSIVENFAEPPQTLENFLHSFLASEGIQFLWRPNASVILRVREGRGFQIIGLHSDKRNTPIAFPLPGEYHIYKCGEAYIGKGKNIPVKFDVSPLQIYALFKEKQLPPEVKAPLRARAGEKMVLGLESIPAGRTLLIQVYSPEGKALQEYWSVLNTARTRQFVFQFPFNAPKGKYRFAVTDHATGLASDFFVNVMEN